MSFKLMIGGSLTKYRTLGQQMMKNLLGGFTGDRVQHLRLKAYLLQESFLAEGIPTADSVRASLSSQRTGHFTLALEWPEGWLTAGSRNGRIGGLWVDRERVVVLTGVHDVGGRRDTVIFCIAELKPGHPKPCVIAGLSDCNWSMAMPGLSRFGEILFRLGEDDFTVLPGRDVIETLKEASGH